MGGAFKERSSELSKKANKFILFSIICLGITAMVTIYVFYSLPSLKNDWSIYLFATIKTIPFWIITLWFFDKYSYERKLEEKYMFKAIIASVIRNHSELLSDEDSGALENKSSKQIMVSKVFETIYEDPNSTGHSKNFLGNKMTKNLNSTMKQLISFIKEIKKN